MRRYLATGIVALFAFTVAAASSAETVILAPGYGELEYEPPAPGTYNLPVLGQAVDGKVRDSNGKATTLHEIMDGRLVLMGFIYTHCPDVNGCPLASYVMKKVQSKLAEDEQLRDQVTLVSLSFDPELDTPDAMMKYSHHFKRRDFDWQFLTTDSEEALQPILDGYGQFRARYYNEDGSYSGSMSHVLRVYLIDRDRQIRNIYSAGFLHRDTVVNDLRTLLAELPVIAVQQELDGTPPGESSKVHAADQGSEEENESGGLEMIAIYISVFSAVLACASLYLSHFRRPRIEVTFGRNIHLYHPEDGGTGIYVSVVFFNTSPTLGTVSEVYLRMKSPDGFEYLLRWLEEWTITTRESDYEFLTVARPFSVQGHSSTAKFLWFIAPGDDEPLMFIPGRYEVSLLLESNAAGKKEKVCEEVFVITDFAAQELERRYKSRSARTQIIPFEGKTMVSAKAKSPA